jgi:hypothetical protein
MKKIFLVILILGIQLTLVAQKFQTIEMKPIVKQGGRYFYDFKKVHGGAYGLQIPLQSLNDEEVNRRYKNYRTYNQLAITSSIIPVVYILTISRNQVVSPSEFWIIFGGALAAAISLELIGQHHIKKGVDRYNSLIIGASSQSLGASLTYKF